MLKKFLYNVENKFKFSEIQQNFRINKESFIWYNNEAFFIDAKTLLNFNNSNFS